jgi:hypothetical protein
VIGVAAPKGEQLIHIHGRDDLAVIIPYTTAQRRFTHTDRLGQLIFAPVGTRSVTPVRSWACTTASTRISRPPSRTSTSTRSWWTSSICSRRCTSFSSPRASSRCWWVPWA